MGEQVAAGLKKKIRDSDKGEAEAEPAEGL